jgi:hypothetical protein
VSLWLTCPEPIGETATALDTFWSAFAPHRMTLTGSFRVAWLRAANKKRDPAAWGSPSTCHVGCRPRRLYDAAVSCLSTRADVPTKEAHERIERSRSDVARGAARDEGRAGVSSHVRSRRAPPRKKAELSESLMEGAARLLAENNPRGCGAESLSTDHDRREEPDGSERAPGAGGPADGEHHV